MKVAGATVGALATASVVSVTQASEVISDCRYSRELKAMRESWFENNKETPHEYLSRTKTSATKDEIVYNDFKTGQTIYVNGLCLSKHECASKLI